MSRMRSVRDSKSQYIAIGEEHGQRKRDEAHQQVLRVVRPARSS